MNLDDIYRSPEVLAMEAAIDARIAREKAAKIDEEAQGEQDKHIAKMIYEAAKEALRKEKLRHKLAEDGFAEEKTRHREERDRHLKAVAQFKVDAEPWRLIVRAEKEATRLKEIQDEQDHQQAMIRLKQRLHISEVADGEDPIEVEKRKAADHTSSKQR